MAGLIVVAVLIALAVTFAFAFDVGRQCGREEERPRAWGDGYRSGWNAGMADAEGDEA